MFDIAVRIHYNITRTIARCTMLISVGQIIHTPGKRIDFQFSMDLSDVDFGGYRPVAEPVVVTGSIRNSADVLEMTVRMSTTLHAVCDRCAKHFERLFEAEYSCLLAQELQNEETDDDIVLLDSEGRVDAENAAREAFILGMDTKMLCSPDCRGLCPRCGADLNLGPCGCKKENDPRWAALDAMFGGEA
jgi:uncharacterized protein